MVRAWNPEHAIAAHAMPAHENVALGVLEHVAHVQVAGHIRRRQQNVKRGLAVQALTSAGAGWAKSFSRTQYSAQ